MTVAERLFNELHAPDGRVPKLDDYTVVLRELREAQVESYALPQVYDYDPVPYVTFATVTNGNMPTLVVPPLDCHPFLHCDKATNQWVVRGESYPLKGFVLMRAPDGQKGYVFQTFVEVATSLGAVVDWS